MSENNGLDPKKTYTTSSGLVLSSKTYNNIKWFVLIFLPAFGALYSGAALLFGLAYVAQVVGGTALLATFLGITLGISNSNFQKAGADGSIGAQIQGNEVVLSNLSLPNIAPEELAAKKSITIQVNPQGTGLSQ
jgi:hypothetical protein